MSARSSALEAAGLLAWSAAVLLVAWYLAFPATTGAWQAAGAQVVAYVATLLPALLLRPRPVLPAGSGPVVIAVSAVLIAAALVYALATGGGPRLPLRLVTAGSAGIGEELFFRGVLWDRLARLLRAPVPLVAVDAALFAASHVPLVLVERAPPWQLAVVLAFGLLFAVLRLVSRGLVLPTALHVAVDLSG
jgi:membrane protease YdiL (CAAX protease family)